ncbi:MAG: spermidine/putrescine ABC transporter substrate-binding protein, partial [Deltaproteobacteria bacterium]|nr:spermidine/putrescine ABC transporter substrate-binding protein [Deltaproteobacteria bacterium]
MVKFCSGLVVVVALALGLVGASSEVWAADPPRQLNLFIWSEYMDPDIITNFEKTHNVKVRQDYYESNEEMIAKLETGRQGIYDVIVPSTYFIPALKSLDLIQPLNHALIPNIKNISSSFT